MNQPPSLHDIDGTVPGWAALIVVDPPRSGATSSVVSCTDYLEGGAGLENPLAAAQRHQKDLAERRYPDLVATFAWNPRARYLAWLNEMIWKGHDEEELTPADYLLMQWEAGAEEESP